MPRWLPITLFLLALTAAGWRAPQPTPVIFAESASIAASLPAEFFSEKIPETNGTIGPSSLARLPDGRLLIAWQENRSDDPADNTIRLLSQDKQGQWGQAKEVATRPIAAGSSFAYVSQLGRPLLYAEGHWLHLWFVSHAISDWRSTAIYHRFSSDNGQHWSAMRKTAVAAGFNPGGLHIKAPLPLTEGALALPLQENNGEINSWLHLAATGQVLAKTRRPPREILLPVGAVNLPSGAESVLQLNGNTLLAAGNPQSNRQRLQLWRSSDGGAHWQNSRLIEEADDGAAEFTHPFLLLAADGRIHLTYNWRRQGLKHLRFSEAWLTEAEQP